MCVIDCPSCLLPMWMHVFLQVLLLFPITWQVRKRLAVGVFVLLGRFPSCIEKTDLSIYNIQISSRGKKTVFDLDLGLQFCVHRTVSLRTNILFRAVNTSQTFEGNDTCLFRCSRQGCGA